MNGKTVAEQGLESVRCGQLIYKFIRSPEMEETLTYEQVEKVISHG